MLNTLESNVFKDELDFKTLENLLSTLDHFTAKKVTREEYNNKKGEIIEKTGENDNSGDFYNIFLPEDLKLGELASIIRRVNKITFEGFLPKYASTNELKSKIVYSIDIIEEKLGKIQDNNEKQKLQIAIKKYLLLYQDLFPDEDTKLLSNKESRQEIINIDTSEKFNEYKGKIVLIKSKEGLSELLEDINSKELQGHFNEAFLERGVNMLRLGMETITQAEQEANMNKSGKITNHTDTILLDEKAQKLRDKIGIEDLKKELKSVRDTGDKEKIEELEIKATNIILKNLYEYPYQATDNNYGYQPNKILEFKEIYCIGFSLLGHAFLSELDIKHKGLRLLFHSALEVDIGGKKFYFDGTSNNEIINYEDLNKKISSHQSGDTENILLCSIYNNKGIELENSGKYEEAIKMFEKAIEIDYIDYNAYINIGNTLNDLGKYEEAIKIYYKAIEIDNECILAYNNIGFALDKLGKYEEAIIIYDKALLIDCNFGSVYINKGNTLAKIGKNKLSNLYKFTGDLLNNNDSSFDILYSEEKQKIREYVNNKNYSKILYYLIELEYNED